MPIPLRIVVWHISLHPRRDSASTLVPGRFSGEGQPLHDRVMVVECLVATKAKGSERYLGTWPDGHTLSLARLPPDPF